MAKLSLRKAKGTGGKKSKAKARRYTAAQKAGYIKALKGPSRKDLGSTGDDTSFNFGDNAF